MARCIARTTKLKRCEKTVEKGRFLYCRTHRPLLLPSLATFAVTFVGFVAAFIQILDSRFFPTPTPSPVPTLTFSASPTITPSPTPRPLADYLYHMVVLDASSTMLESFHGYRTWDIARKTVNEILQKLNPEAHYGLVVIGGSGFPGSGDPCLDPTQTALDFTRMGDLWTFASEIEPGSGGSFDVAFTTAKTRLEGLPREVIRNLIFVSGPFDTCQGEDEWLELENTLELAKTVDLYSEVIILDENGARSQSIAERIKSLHENVNAQAPQNIQDVEQASLVAVSNVSNRNNLAMASLGTRIPTEPTRFALASPSTSPIAVVATPSRTSTVPPSPSNTFTPTLTFTATLFPEVLSIISPSNNTTLSCVSASECIVTVNIQWVPDSQRQGRNLSLWVRPLPELPDGSGQDYWPQTAPQHLGNGVWQVSNCYVGQVGDEKGLSFAIYAIVTNDHPGSQPVTTLPSNLNKTTVFVTRGSP